jgi:hypothetical protein
MLDLALLDDENGRFLIIMNCTEDASKQQKQTEISRVLGTVMQLVVRMGTAQQFLNTQNLKNDLVALIPKVLDELF